MGFIIYTLVLLFQLDPVLSNCTVDNCNSDNCNGNNCYQCVNGYYLFADKCHECFLVCRGCDNCYQCAHTSCPSNLCAFATCPASCSSSAYIYCTSCPDGFHLRDGRCFRCFHTNCKCSESDDCIGCLPGKFGTSSFCNNNCPINCTSCASSLDCSECIAGTYGQSCQTECISTCHDGTCNKDLGTCSQGCAANQYLDAENTCQSCPRRCSSCKDYYHCTSCNRNRWGLVCQYDCVGCYNTECSNTDGCSSGCDSKYFQTYNEDINGYECTQCPGTCMNCKNDTHCTECKVGYWGNVCDKTCGVGCDTIACDRTRGCTSGCISGYYTKVYRYMYTCERCPPDCTICSQHNVCHECQERYYLSDTKTCVRCSNHCRNKICNQNDGSCTYGCLDNWTGLHCNKGCSANCLQCSQSNASDCSLCKPDFFGTSCENKCSPNCMAVNGNQICENGDGLCVYGCKSRYWGPYCNKSCEEGCKDNVCNGTTGKGVN